MQVEILGVLRGARGPGHDMILAQLHGAKPEYTGVVAGMSGSPVYIGDKLLGSLSYRIGQFSKDPIAGITPIEQMLEVRDLPMEPAAHDAVSQQTHDELESASGRHDLPGHGNAAGDEWIPAGSDPALAGKDGGDGPGDGRGRRKRQFPSRRQTALDRTDFCRQRWQASCRDRR